MAESIESDSIIETNGCGVASISDNDGWLDVLILSGTCPGSASRWKETNQQVVS
jgi:hypothetical protein